MQFWRKNKVRLILSIAVILLVLSPIIAGCTSTGAAAKGWSGATVYNSNVYIGSLTGQLMGLEISTGNQIFNAVTLDTVTSGGFLGCGASSSGIAIYGSPIVVGDTVYVAGYSNGKIYSFKAANGVKGWSFQPAGRIQPIIGGLASDGVSLYFGTTSGNLYSVDTVNAAQNWEFNAGEEFKATPLVTNGTLYIGCFDKNLYAIDTDSGTEKWRFEAGGPVVSTPVLRDGVLYFGTLNREFYAVDAISGTLKWKAAETAGNWYWANPVVLNNKVYAPNMDGKIYIFDVVNGQQVIEPLIAGTPISSSPAIYNTNIIIAGENGNSWTLDTTTNILNKLADKSLGKVFAPLTISDGVVYIHTQGNMLYAVKADTGVVIWNK